MCSKHRRSPIPAHSVRQIPAQYSQVTLLIPCRNSQLVPLVQMLGELVTAGLGPADVDSLYELSDRVRAAEQDKDPPPHAGLSVCTRGSMRM